MTNYTEFPDFVDIEHTDEFSTAGAAIAKFINSIPADSTIILDDVVSACYELPAVKQFSEFTVQRAVSYNSILPPAAIIALNRSTIRQMISQSLKIWIDSAVIYNRKQV